MSHRTASKLLKPRYSRLTLEQLEDRCLPSGNPLFVTSPTGGSSTTAALALVQTDDNNNDFAGDSGQQQQNNHAEYGSPAAQSSLDALQSGQGDALDNGSAENSLASGTWWVGEDGGASNDSTSAGGDNDQSSATPSAGSESGTSNDLTSAGDAFGCTPR